MGLVCADLTPPGDWPDEPGSNIAGHDQALPTIVESATARLGRARVDADDADDAALMEELVDKADWVMTLARRQGRDRVLQFGPGVHEQTSGAPATK